MQDKNQKEKISIDVKTNKFIEDVSGTEEANRIMEEVSYTKSGHTFQKLQQLRNLKDIHKEMYRNCSAIVNVLSPEDIYITVKELLKYILLLEDNADYENNEGIGITFVIITQEMVEKVIEAKQ